MLIKQKLAIDLEWDITTKRFRCGCLQKENAEVVSGTTDVNKFAAALAQHKYHGVEFVGHNVVQADIRKLYEWGMPVPENWQADDSMIAARLFFPHWPDKGLKGIGREFGYYWEDEHTTDDDAQLLQYCAKDTQAPLQLLKLWKSQQPEQQCRLLQLQNRMVQAFFVCEMAGIKLQASTLKKDEEDRCKEILELAPLLPDPAMLTNDGVLRSWLQTQYTEKELRLLGKTKGGDIGIDVSVLKILPRQTKQLNTIIVGRYAQNYKTLYIDRPLKMMDANGFLDVSYKHLVARTHRRSTEPNIQNWPEQARHCVVSRFAGGKIISCDFKNLEARLFAYEAGCRLFLDTLVEGGYGLVAERVFGWTGITKQDPRYKVLKILVLAITYNMSVGMMKRNLYISHGMDISYNEAQDYMDMFFEKFPELHLERERRKAFGWKMGYAQSLIGARMVLPVLPYKKIVAPEDIQWREKSVENKAINYPTQNLASYVTGTAMLDVQKGIRDICRSWGDYVNVVLDSRKTEDNQWLDHNPYIPGFPIIEVHDELVFDVVPGKEEEMKEFARHHMTKLATLKAFIPSFTCPIDVDIVEGNYWV